MTAKQATQATGFDISSINLTGNAEIGHEFEVEHPVDRTKTGIFITVVGAHAGVVTQHEERMYNERQRREIMAKKRGKEVEYSLADYDQMASQAAAVRIIGWRGLIRNGEVLPYSRENALQLMTEHKWLRGVVLEESSDIGNFTGN